VLCGQGAIQNLHPYTTVKTVEGATQTIAQGPVASQEAIKMLGTNGGGFFNANSAHPFENPTPFANFLQIVLIFVIPAGLTYTSAHGRRHPPRLGDFCAMSAMFLIGVFVCYGFEQTGNPILVKHGIQAPPRPPNRRHMEGKETASASPARRCSHRNHRRELCAVNSAHDALTPLGGLVPMFNMQTDEVIFAESARASTECCCTPSSRFSLPG